ncbi:MAG TPA: PilN domain-containing protein [Rhizomicrobium sp.]
MSIRPVVEDDNVTVLEILGIVLGNWKDEIARLVREKFALWDSAQSTQMFVRMQEHVTLLCGLRDGALENIAQIERASGADKIHAREISRTVAHLELGTDIALILPADSFLHPRLTMPRARRGALASALRYEIERLSPIDPSNVYYDFVADDAASDTSTIEMELRIVRKALVDDSVALCRTAGLAVCGIYADGDSRPLGWRSFPIDRSALARTLARRFGLAALGVLALLLLMAVLVGAYIRGTSQMDALTDAVADAGLQAARVERLQQTIDMTTADLTLPGRQKQAPLFVGVLAELTQILPDGTWLTELTMDGPKIRIQGASPAASDLIGLIDRSPRFANTQFEAPLVRDTAAKVDRFDLSFGVRGAKP